MFLPNVGAGTDPCGFTPFLAPCPIFQCPGRIGSHDLDSTDGRSIEARARPNAVSRCIVRRHSVVQYWQQYSPGGNTRQARCQYGYAKRSGSWTGEESARTNR